MNEFEQVQVVRQLRDRARIGDTGTEIARDLKERYGTVTVCRLVMDAFGMRMREAREWELLLAHDHGGDVASLDATWAPYLSQPDLWPKREIRLEIQEKQDRQFEVTLRLIEYLDTSLVYKVLLDWGDGQRSETQTQDLPLSHQYVEPGVYSFGCQIPDVGWNMQQALKLEVKGMSGTLMIRCTNPW